MIAVFTSVPERKLCERKRIQRTQEEQAAFFLFERIRRQFYIQRIRARKAGVINTLTFDELKQTLASSEGYCSYCRRLVGIENLGADHIMAISKGGSNSVDNITAACLSCNASKGARSIPPHLSLAMETVERKHKKGGQK